MRMSKPQRDALAFRIWAWCRTFGWEHTAREIAAGLNEQDDGDVSGIHVGALCRHRGWSRRIRHERRDAGQLWPRYA